MHIANLGLVGLVHPLCRDRPTNDEVKQDFISSGLSRQIQTTTQSPIARENTLYYVDVKTASKAISDLVDHPNQMLFEFAHPKSHVQQVVPCEEFHLE